MAIRLGELLIKKNLGINDEEIKPKEVEVKKEEKNKGGYLQKVREEYPRAYEGWSGEEDGFLLGLFEVGMPIEKISERV